MKFFLTSTLLSMSLFVHSFSIVPDKTVTPLLDIFSPDNKKISEDLMEVRVSTYSKRGVISKGRSKITLQMEDYLKALSQSKAVYEMIPTSSSHNSDRPYFGTAFHIGGNLVLTNQHVLSPDSDNTTSCGRFELYQKITQETFTCKKVHYCSIEHDICLIEMKPIKKCLSAFCKKYEYVEMKDREALKLKENLQVDFGMMQTAVLTAIGNTMGYGIHYSQGNGFELSPTQIKFFAPIRTGNSGGPLIGEDGLVWGVVKRESAKKVGPDAYNIAASMDIVIDLIKENVTDDTVLENFYNAIEN